MPYVHPALMSLLILLLAHVLLLGSARFRASHLGQRTVFAWRRHVLLGQAAAAGLALGALSGMFFAWRLFDVVGGLGWHFRNALWLILPLAAASLATGLYLDRRKARRTALPLAHGLANLLLFLAVLCQAATGLRILLR